MNIILLLLTIGLSWLALRCIYGENLSVLGFKPLNKRINQFLTGLFIGSSASLILVGAHTLFYKSEWVLITFTSSGRYLTVLWEQFVYVVLIELIFRGIILYVLLKYLRPVQAILISALAFTLYEIWPLMNLDWVLLSNTTHALLFGIVLSYTFYRSGSLLPSIGIHFAFIFTDALFFMSFHFGPLLFFETSRTTELSLFLVLAGHFGYHFLRFLLLLTAVHFLFSRPKMIRYIEVG